MARKTTGSTVAGRTGQSANIGVRRRGHGCMCNAGEQVQAVTAACKGKVLVRVEA